jgi:hypothetical protein
MELAAVSELHYCHDLGVWLHTGFGLVNGFTEHIYTPLGNTRNYSATANLHTSQIAAAHTKHFPAYCLNQPFPGNGFHNGDFSASRAQALPSPTLFRTACQLNWIAISSQPPLRSSTKPRLTYNHFVRTGEKTSFPTILLLLLAYPLAWKLAYRVVA